MSPESAPRGFFRCPHCRQKTITAWTKLRTRGACPACGGRFVAGAWGIIPALLVMPFAVFAPIALVFHFHPVGFALYWAVFSAGMLLAFALFATVFLFTTPLYRKGSVAARWDAIAFFTFVAALAVAAMMNTGFDREAGLGPDPATSLRFGWSGARDDDKLIAAKVSYSNAAMQEALKDALRKAGIAYQLETREGKEYVGWTRAQDAAARKIQRELDGSDLPPRRAVSFDSNPELEKEFAAWLTAKGLKHESRSAYGRRYIVWEGPDDLMQQFMRERPSVPCDKRAAAEGGKKSCG